MYAPSVWGSILLDARTVTSCTVNVLHKITIKYTQYKIRCVNQLHTTLISFKVGSLNCIVYFRKCYPKVHVIYTYVILFQLFHTQKCNMDVCNVYVVIRFLYIRKYTEMYIIQRKTVLMFGQVILNQRNYLQMIQAYTLLLRPYRQNLVPQTNIVQNAPITQVTAFTQSTMVQSLHINCKLYQNQPLTFHNHGSAYNKNRIVKAKLNHS